MPFSFTVPAYGYHGRTLQRSFAHTDPLVIVAYGVTAKITIKPTSALDSLVSVFTQTEFSATATFYVDRFYESALLRMPEPESDTKEMTFMFGGPVRAKLACDSRAAVVGSAGYAFLLLF